MLRIRRVLLVVVMASFVEDVAAQGSPVGPEFRVNTYTTGAQIRATAASFAAGGFVVFWVSPDFQNADIFGQRFASSGVPVGPEFRVNTYTTGYQRFKSVASDAAGNFVVVWQSGIQSGADLDIVGQRFASSGVPIGPEFRVNTYTTDTQQYPSVASDASGNFFVAWSDFRLGAGYELFAQRFSSSGGPLGPAFRVNTTTSGSQTEPWLAADPSGNVVVVWTVLATVPSSGVFGQRYAASGQPMGPEFQIHTSGFSHERPAVAVDGSGNFVVVWAHSGDGSGDGVFARRYASSGAPLGPEFRVNTMTLDHQWTPSVAADAAGNFVVVWQSNFPQDGSSTGVFGQRFSSSGTPVGPEFQVNTYTTNTQGLPVVVSDPAGDFAAFWSSLGQDDPAYGVFGQRYSGIFPVELIHVGVE